MITKDYKTNMLHSCCLYYFLKINSVENQCVHFSCCVFRQDYFDWVIQQQLVEMTRSCDMSVRRCATVLLNVILDFDGNGCSPSLDLTHEISRCGNSRSDMLLLLQVLLVHLTKYIFLPSNTISIYFKNFCRLLTSFSITRTLVPFFSLSGYLASKFQVRCAHIFTMHISLPFSKSVVRLSMCKHGC